MRLRGLSHRALAIFLISGLTLWSGFALAAASVTKFTPSAQLQGRTLQLNAPYHLGIASSFNCPRRSA